MKPDRLPIIDQFYTADLKAVLSVTDNSKTEPKSVSKTGTIDPLIHSLQYLQNVATEDGHAFIAYAIEDLILLVQQYRDGKSA